MKYEPVEFITQACDRHYSVEEVQREKERLFKDTETARNKHKLRKIIRKGANKKLNNIGDIITIFNTLPVNDTPKYVALDINNLPPLGAIDTNVTKLRDEVNALRQSVGAVEAV